MEGQQVIELYRGSVNTWECDEMGHMNVRFYVNRMMEGLAELAHQAAMPLAFTDQAQSTLRPRDQHIRYIREVLAGRPFTMTGCVLEVTESSALIYQQIIHASGEPGAAFRTWVDHVEVDSGRAFPWSKAARAALEKLAGEAPADLAPRSIDMNVAPILQPRLSDCDAIGAPTIGRGVVPAEHCGADGRMLAEMFVGRLSDSVAHLLGPWRDKLAAASGAVPRQGGAVLEYRIVYRRWPRAGDRFVIRSGLAFIKEKTHSLVHWIMDPNTGEAWATSQAVAIALNLDTRKIIPATSEMQAALGSLAPKGLAV
jgi:acyl-CoA thioester hydrolase